MKVAKYELTLEELSLMKFAIDYLFEQLLNGIEDEKVKPIITTANKMRERLKETMRAL